MISVIMPYWKRQALLDRALARYDYLYRKLDLEIIVIDDGSPVSAVGDSKARIILLPRKEESKNPCVPLNVGAREARGDILVLTNPECWHRTAVLPVMQKALEELGPKGYVAASAWCPDTKRWHCHPTIKGPGQAPLPQGAGLHHCAMLYKRFYEEIGGFDENYRDGCGYEDNDFLWRLEEAGAKFKILENCIVDHPRTDDRHTPEAFKINRRIFESTWSHRLSS